MLLGFAQFNSHMLSHLSVRHFALVDTLEIDFTNGMSVVTGETGAGKSIILNALSMALGDRADQSLIASDQDRAEIHAVFDISADTAAAQWLSDRDLDPEVAILRRIINRDGRSRAFINGSPSTATDLKHLGDLLIDIHSQHEHQSLLRRAHHLSLLDAFGGHETETRAFREAYLTWRSNADRLASLLDDSREVDAHRQLLRYQLDELKAAQVSEGEQPALESEQRRLANTTRITQLLTEVDALLDDPDHGANHRVQAALRHLADPVLEDIKGVQELLDNAAIQLTEALSELGHFLGTVEIDPDRLTQVEARLSLLYELSRKHHVEPEALPPLVTAIESELADLDGDDQTVAELTRLCTGQEASLREMSEDLSRRRRTAADALIKRVSEVLAQLNMSGARLSVAQHKRETMRDSGIDDLEFLITTAENQTPDSLRRIASGGELSRISLAIQLAIAESSGQHQSLVFDEVDVGVGGATADTLGGLLRQLGRYQQILCVTHLPQVAAQGHHHMVVEKTSTSGEQRTSIRSINKKERIDELARMLAGQDLTDESRAHAQAMIKAIEVRDTKSGRSTVPTRRKKA